jgi:hypothetical protein
MLTDGPRGPARPALERHLAACPRCRSTRAGFQVALDAVRSDPLLSRVREIDWDRLRDATVARALAEAGGSRAPEIGWVLAGAAAALALAFALTQALRQSAPMASPGTEAFLEKMELQRASLDAASYLADSRQLLVGVLAPASCPPAGRDVSLEKGRSKDLLLKAQLLERELARPELARVLPVCQDLEAVLLEILRLPDCAPPERLTEIARLVRAKELLLRLPLVEGEL